MFNLNKSNKEAAQLICKQRQVQVIKLIRINCLSFDWLYKMNSSGNQDAADSD